MRIKLIQSKLRSHDGNAKQTNAHQICMHLTMQYHDVILIKDTYVYYDVMWYGIHSKHAASKHWLNNYIK
jgi:hypothetical protein